MKYCANLTPQLRTGLCSQAANMAVNLENILVKIIDEQSASEIFYGSNPK